MQVEFEPWIHVFLLGNFAVLRRDGTAIQEDEWRTSKNRDLLRLLALENGKRVRLSILAETLWPDVAEDRAAASLRTAVSHLRRLLGPHCVVRRDAGIALEHAWVDLEAFEARAAKVHVACREGDFERALNLAMYAELLYSGDFAASSDCSEWAQQACSKLRECGHLLLVDVAEAALELGRHRPALERARAAVALDPLGERAQRALMRAHAGLGEFGSALRVYEAARASLAAEVGVGPSPETRALHLALLRGDGAAVRGVRHSTV